MMYLDKDGVHFQKCDQAFVERFGAKEAAQMVLYFKIEHPNLPFIYDTFQLADFLGRSGRKGLFDLVKNTDSHYKTVTVKKKNGKIRIIHAPDRLLKNHQTQILRNFLAELPVSPYATAYSKGKSLADNASPHVGKRYILKVDIIDFFGSIRFEQVYSAAFNTRYFPKQIGVMLTTLCSLKDVLPQGAPTSPALSNLVMKNFDNNIGKWCENHGIAYTRYCDDMTFSSDSPLYHVYQKVKTMLENMGFELNEKKTRFVTNAERQNVTGLTVNEKVSVPRDYKRKLRQEVYQTLKFGLQNMQPDEKLHYYNQLVGKLHYVLQIEPDNEWFRDALTQMLSEKFFSE